MSIFGFTKCTLEGTAVIITKIHADNILATKKLILMHYLWNMNVLDFVILHYKIWFRVAEKYTFWYARITRVNTFGRTILPVKVNVHYNNEHDAVWNQQPPDCLLKRVFRRKSKKTSKLRVAGLCEGNWPVYTSLWLMLFVCHTTQNKVYLILSYLILIPRTKGQ